MEGSSKRGKPIKSSAKKQDGKKISYAGIQHKEEFRTNQLPSWLSIKIGNRAGRQKEKEVFYMSKILSIDNSRAVILNSQLMNTAGLVPEQEILIQANEGIITIIQAKGSGLNLDLSSWDKQFRSANKKAGYGPESDLFGGTENEFDTKEW